MSRRSLNNLRSSRSLKSSDSLASPKKVASYSWEIEGSDYTRKILFKALKDGEKVGFGLGGKGQRTEVVFVRNGTQSYWKGLQKGYKVVTVNGLEVNDITVKSSIFDAASSGKDFTIGFLVPNKPDWADNDKDGVSALADDSGPPADDQPNEKKVDLPIEEEVKVSADDKPIIDKGKDEDTKEENKDEGIFGAADDTDEEFETIMKLSDELKATEPEDLSQDALEKATKEELEEMKRQKEEEYKKLQNHEARLKELIKKKEKEFKDAVTRKNLEDLKSLRRRRKEVAARAKRVLDDLERIRRMLELRLAELAKGIKDLASISAARDARLREMEAAVKIMEGKMLS